MQTCTRRLEFDAAHRVPGHNGKCRNLHGHRYAVEITVEGETQPEGMIADFGMIKEKVGGWIDDQLDHNVILWADDPVASELAKVAFMISPFAGRAKMPFEMGKPPTAENIAEMLYVVAGEFLNDCDMRVVHVRVRETPNCWADYGIHMVVPQEK